MKIANDNNSLNEKFYSELLHIIGLEEVKDRSKKVIKRANKPNSGSLLENCITQLDINDKLSNLSNLANYGNTQDERLFNVALELVIIWINRILFLKLLEGQLVSFSQNEKLAFLNNETIKGFNELNNLFFGVLAKPQIERSEANRAKFNKIPYLNSSLFDSSTEELEHNCFTINSLDSNQFIPVFNRTILNDNSNKRLTGNENTLKYLFEFLNAYNFGSNNDEVIQTESNLLINASVLGLIFEKINGYKDGSFFTPSFITMYMCRETIRRAVVDKFKTIEPSIESFDDVKAYTAKNYKNKDTQQFNQLINSITICDPAVGSGHFLVSALNEIIAIKSELGVLINDNNELLNIGVDVVNDELVITERSGDLFKYYPNNPASQQIQKTLFHEKQTIIENCLFGVDINPNSVKICRLRLWIELLKNAYYKDFANNELETLPNIDINIKCGNSLISRFDLTDNIESLLSNLKHGNHKNITVDYYRKKVLEYKNAKNKAQKQDLEKLIQKIKQEFSAGLYQASLFDDDNKQSEQEIFYNKQNAFEWRFEFPEVLADNGEYKGFDIVIGNPPYIMEDENKDAFIGLHEHICYQGKADIWHLFTGLGLNVLKNSGVLSYIAKNQWLESQSASKMRKVVYKHGNLLAITDFGANMVFESAAQQTMLFFIQKNSTNSEHTVKYKKYVNVLSTLQITELLNIDNDENLKIVTKTIPKEYDESANLTFSDDAKECILSKIESKINFVFDERREIIQGIIGGPDDAFIVKEADYNKFTEQEKNYLKKFHTNTGRYYTPEAKQYIFYLSAKNFADKNIDDFPNIKQFFEPNKQDLINRKGKYKTPSKVYFYLHRERDESFFIEGEKLIFASRTDGTKFTFTTEQFYGSRNLFFIKSNRTNLRYITSLLNSKLMLFYMHERLKHTGNLLQIDKNQFMKIPLFIPDNSHDFNDMVDKILSFKEQQQDTAELEQQIDEMVYKLYDLTPEEIAIIESHRNSC